MVTHPTFPLKKVIGFLLIFLLLCGSIGLVAVFASAPASGYINANPTASLTKPTDSSESGESLCAQLHKLDPKLPANLYQVEQKRYQACLESYNARLTPKPIPDRQKTFEAPHTIVAPTAIVPRTPAGSGTILDHPASPLGPLYVIENSWVFENLGKRYQVFVGARREEGPEKPRNTMQGIVVVQVTTLDGEGLSEGGYYELPVKNGPVRVVGAQGQRLILQAENGDMFYFDLPARKFVSSLTEKVATATPPAKPTTRPYP